jgi:hypothetical protein
LPEKYPHTNNIATKIKSLTNQVKEDGGLHSWPPKRMEPEKYFYSFFQKSKK